MSTSIHPTATTKNIIVISDLHNNYNTALDIINFYGLRMTEKYHLVFLGDLVHKGPAEGCSLLVDLVKTLVEEGKATCVRGNHDFTCDKGKFNTTEHIGELTPEQAEWLKSLPLFVRYNNTLFMHAGMTGSTETVINKLIDDGLLPREGDWTTEMVNKAEASLSNKLKKRLQNAMDTRYVRGEEKKLVSWGNEEATDSYWAETYDGSLGYVIFGHNPWKDLAYFPCAMGIDLGAGADVTTLDTPKYGMGYEMEKSSRVGVLTIVEHMIIKAAAWTVGASIFGGFPQFSTTLSLDMNWSIRSFGALKDQPYEVNELYDEYCRELAYNDRVDNVAHLGSILNFKYGFNLPLPEKNLVENTLQRHRLSSSLNIEHAAGSDETPSPRLKAELIEESVNAMIPCLAYGLTNFVDTEIYNNWLPLVKYIRKSEGYGERFKALIQEQKILNAAACDKSFRLKEFYDKLLVSDLAMDMPINSEVMNLFIKGK